jgi:hypothetical protein
MPTSLAVGAPLAVGSFLDDNGSVPIDRPETPEVGWAVQVSAEEHARRRVRSATLKSWLSPRNLLVFILLVWNGYFLASLLYGSSVQDDAVKRIVVTLWIWSELAILLVAWSIWAIRSRRRRTALPPPTC